MEHLESAENMGFRVMRFPNRILYFSSGHAISESHIFFTYLIGDSEIAGPEKNLTSFQNLSGLIQITFFLSLS